MVAVEGGSVEDIFANFSGTRVTVIDYDIDGNDNLQLNPYGQSCVVAEWSVDFRPERVNAFRKAFNKNHEKQEAT